MLSQTCQIYVYQIAAFAYFLNCFIVNQCFTEKNHLSLRESSCIAIKLWRLTHCDMIFQHFRIIWTIQILISFFIPSFRDTNHQTKLIHKESRYKTSNKVILPAVLLRSKSNNEVAWDTFQETVRWSSPLLLGRMMTSPWSMVAYTYSTYRYITTLVLSLSIRYFMFSEDDHM